MLEGGGGPNQLVLGTLVARGHNNSITRYSREAGFNLVEIRIDQ